MSLPIRRSGLGCLRLIGFVAMLGLGTPWPVLAIPPVTTSLVIPLEGEVAWPPVPLDVVHLVGEVHIVSQVVFGSDADTIMLHINLDDVQGAGSATGRMYLATGATSHICQWPPDPIGGLPPNPCAPFTALFKFWPPGPVVPDGSARFAELPITFFLEFGGDGTLTAVALVVGSDVLCNPFADTCD